MMATMVRLKRNLLSVVLASALCALVLPAPVHAEVTTYGRATRIEGGDRYETAVELSKSAFGTSRNVVLASGETFPDALAAAPLAGVLNAPILLTRRATIPAGVVREMRRLQVKSVFIVGGPPAVSSDVESRLSRDGFVVAERLAGRDRYETMREIVRYVTSHAEGAQPTPFVARGDDFADALAVAPLAYASHASVILVSPRGAPSASRDAYKLVNPGSSIAVGGDKAVPRKVLSQLAARSFGRSELERAALRRSEQVRHGAGGREAHLDDPAGHGRDHHGRQLPRCSRGGTGDRAICRPPPVVAA